MYYCPLLCWKLPVNATRYVLQPPRCTMQGSSVTYKVAESPLLSCRLARLTSCLPCIPSVCMCRCPGNLEQIHNSIHSTLGSTDGEMG
jgi:hypothetical protein